MTPNLINPSWGSLAVFGLVLFLSFMLAAFLFFRQTKEEFASEEEIISFLTNNLLGWLIGARLLFYLTNLEQFGSLTKLFLPWRYPGLSFTGGYLGIIMASQYWSKRHQFQIWKLTDSATIPLMIFFIGFFSGQWLTDQQTFYLTLVGLGVLTIIIAIWSLKSYRSLIWYPSGKIGFTLLLTNAIFFLGFSLLAFFSSSGLYLEMILGSILFFWSLTIFCLRSENELVKNLLKKITDLTKND